MTIKEHIVMCCLATTLSYHLGYKIPLVCTCSITQVMCFTNYYVELEYDVIILYTSVVHKLLGYEHQNILNVRIWQPS